MLIKYGGQILPLCVVGGGGGGMTIHTCSILPDIFLTSFIHIVDLEVEGCGGNRQREIDRKRQTDERQN